MCLTLLFLFSEKSQNESFDQADDSGVINESKSWNILQYCSRFYSWVGDQQAGVYLERVFIC